MLYVTTYDYMTTLQGLKHADDRVLILILLLVRFSIVFGKAAWEETIFLLKMTWIHWFLIALVLQCEVKIEGKIFPELFQLKSKGENVSYSKAININIAKFKRSPHF